MNLLLAYMATDPERLRAALAPHRERLRVPTTEAGEAVASCGLGFYQGGEILLQRRPRLVAQDDTLVDLYDLLKDLRTDTLLGQVRGHAATRLAKNENTPPFRFRGFLFAHRGALPDKQQDRVTDELTRGIPDFLRRNLRGQTESELFFHAFLGALHEASSANIEDVNLSADVVLKALTRTLTKLGEATRRHGAELGPQQFVISNGRMLVVVQHGEGPAPLCFLRLGAVSDGGRTYEHFRGVLCFSPPGEAAPPEQGSPTVDIARLAPNHALLIQRDLNPRIVPLSR